MAEGTRVYSINQVAFTWGGIDLMTGIQADTEIVVNDTVPDKWTQEDVGIAGASTVQSFNPSRSGSIEMQINRGSDLFQKLMAIIELDEKLRNQVASGLMTDASTGEKETFQGMRIANRPPRTKGFAAAGAATFMWIYSRSDFIPSDGDDNLVGAGITPGDPLGEEPAP